MMYFALLVTGIGIAGAALGFEWLYQMSVVCLLGIFVTAYIGQVN